LSRYDDEKDNELLKLLPFLKLLSGEEVEDVRPLIASKYRLKELIAKIQL
jgi:TFIIF-interacting CTD phosphatase-like protein